MLPCHSYFYGTLRSKEVGRMEKIIICIVCTPPTPPLMGAGAEPLITFSKRVGALEGVSGKEGVTFFRWVAVFT